MRLVLLLALSLPLSPTAAEAPELSGEKLDDLVTLYKHLHAHPELSYYEKETAARMARELRDAGFQVTEGFGGTGVVGVLENGAGPTLMIRADMDGLPVVEQTGAPYASDVRALDDSGQDVGVMHACAHDTHMTSWVGTARNLAAMTDEWSGTVVMIAQPAEERGGGARAMLAEGLFERFPVPDNVIALHSHPSLQTGSIGYRLGFAMANVDSVDITIPGLGGHGAYPHLAKDPIVLAAQIILGLQTIVSREVDPQDAAVVTVGSIHGGAKHNIIPPEVKLQLTVRSYSDETRRMLLDSIERIAVKTAEAYGMPADRLPTVSPANKEYTPAVYNSPELGKRLLPVWERLLGSENVIAIAPEMGGEDFARYGRTEHNIPIFLFRLGTIDPKRIEESKKPGAPGLPSLHSPFFRPEPVETVRTGVRAMTAAALELLGAKP